MFFSFSWNNVNCSPVKTFLSDSFLACINLSASAFSLSESIGGGGGGGGEGFVACRGGGLYATAGADVGADEGMVGA